MFGETTGARSHKKEHVPCLKVTVTLIAVCLTLPASASEKVSLRQSRDHEFTTAGFYAAQWQGYYDEAGLEVEIKPGFTPARSSRRCYSAVR